MPLILPRSVMYMVPRAASTWCRQAIRNGGLKYREHGPKHSTELPKDAPGFRFCMVREAAPWVRSRWTLGPWTDQLSQFWDIDYTKFREAVNDTAVKMYFAQYTSLCQFVGKAENAADDLVKALRQAGEDFDETALRDTPRINESPKSGDPVGEVFWQMKRDDLGKLPAATIGRLPIELIPKLPQGVLAGLPSDVLVPLTMRMATEAMQAAGAGTRVAKS